jgi:predicted metal-dependent phosphoesterase TrpH
MNFSRLVFIVPILFFLNSSAQEKNIQFRWIDGFAKVDARMEIKIPDILNYKTLKCDFHIHTIFSDGQVLPAERVNEAWREGLDVIAITDHTTPQPNYVVSDYNTSFQMARNTAEKRGITLIQGTEYTKSEPIGHLNILFTKDANFYAQKDLSPDDALDHAGAEGAFVQYNHPGWPDKNSELSPFHIRHLEKKNIRAVEVINSNEYYPVAMDYCMKYNIAPISNSDIHPPIHAAYDVEKTHRNLTLVFATDNSEASVKEALLAGRTVALANNMLVGKPEFIGEIIRQSLQVSKLKMGDYEFSCNVTNTSDITYVFNGPGFRQFIFPANSTVQISELTAEAEMVYQVENTYVNSVNHLEIPLMLILTGKDEVMMPFIRQNLTLIDPASRIEVSCSTPGAEISYTLDGNQPNEASTLYTMPLVLNKSSVLTMKAFKPGMMPSRTLRRQVILNIPHDAERLKLTQNGLRYQYFEGAFFSATEIRAKGNPISEGLVNYPDISIAKADDSFGIIFTGYLYVPLNGEYKFSIESDDGALLKISEVELLNNDGSHSMKKVTGVMQLTKGFHPLEILYFDDSEEQELRLFWTIPGNSELLIEPGSYFVK